MLEKIIGRLGYLEKSLLLGFMAGILSCIFALGFYTLLMVIVNLVGSLLGVFGFFTLNEISDFSLIAVEYENKLVLLGLIVLGGLLSGVLVYFIEPLAEGPGVDTAIMAYHAGAWFKPRVPFIKSIASALFIGLGCSGGVQGPSIQIGAGAGSILAKLLKLNPSDCRLVIVAGMAGALSSIFRCPLGSALFAIEVLYRRDIEVNALFPALIASITSYALSSLIFETGVSLPRFRADINSIFHPLSIVSYIVLGLVAGILALAYIKIYLAVRRLFSAPSLNKSPSIKCYKTIIGALVTGLIGVYAPIALGTGSNFIYNTLSSLIKGETLSIQLLGLDLVPSLLLLMFCKIIATSFSIGSGGSGGLFAPSIFIGVILGLIYGELVASHITPLPSYVYAYVGVACLFGAASKTPIATSFMVAEMSNNYILVVPALISSLIASTITGNKTLYQAQITRRRKLT